MAGLDDLTDLFHGLAGTPPAPTAQTRVTHTPIAWGHPSNGAYGEYQPGNGTIVLDKDTFPQDAMPTSQQGNVLRHESVHDLLRGDAINPIQSYLQSSQQMPAAQQGLRDFDPSAAGSAQRTAAEAPAYAVTGRTLGLDPGISEQYARQMPPGIRQKYEQLMEPTRMQQIAMRYGTTDPPEIFMRAVAERVRQTAAQLGISPQEALQKFAQGELPLAAISSK
jgi:hypothetical protein